MGATFPRAGTTRRRCMSPVIWPNGVSSRAAAPPGRWGPLQPYRMPIELVAREILPAESKLTLVASARVGGGGGEPRPWRTGWWRRPGWRRGAWRLRARPMGARLNQAPYRTGVNTSYEYGKDWTSGNGGGGFGGGGGRGGGVEALDVAGNLVFAGNGLHPQQDEGQPLPKGSTSKARSW